MRNWAGKIVVPALIVGLAAVQSFGIDAGRALRYSRGDFLWRGAPQDTARTAAGGESGTESGDYPDTLPANAADTSDLAAPDSTTMPDAAAKDTPADSAALTDSLSKAAADSLAAVSDTVPPEPKDTVYLLDTLGAVRDTVLVPSALKDTDPLKYKYFVALKDSLTRAVLRDSLLAAGDTAGTALFDSLYTKDSLESLEAMKGPVIFARDTIVVPDSLKETDPLKYKYYIALKDSLTRAELRDSLLAEGDTLTLQLFDSLYTKDSTEVAEAAFLAWYNSLTKKERRKYDTEQAFQQKLAEVNAKVAHKDSLKYIRDSTIEATPRILETYAVPDSMQYKRMIMWQHDRSFNDVNILPVDTTYNLYYHDQPPLRRDLAVTSLGISGSATESYNYFRREKTDNAIFYTPYAPYTYSAESLPMYNTKTSYTELAYWGTLLGKNEKEETNIRVMTTQNILPSLNIMLEYDRFGGNGMLQDEKTDNRTFVAAGNYLGKRYLLHAGYIYNRVKRTENGGITDNTWIRDTTVDAKEIDVALTSASSKIKQNTIFLDQSYRIPFNFIRNIQSGYYKERKSEKARRDSLLAIGDSESVVMAAEISKSLEVKTVADSVDRDITSAFIGHSSEYSVYTRNYTDAISTSDATGRDFYHDNFFINPTASADSMRVMRFENRVYIRLQPWKADGIVSKLDIGIGDKLLNYYNYDQYNYLKTKNNTSLNSLYLYAGVRGQYKSLFHWDATGDYTFLGHEINDFGIKANIEFDFYPFRRERNSPLSLSAHFETTLREPDYYEQKLTTNHYRWDNDFGKISTTKVSGRLYIPHWQLEAEFDYALLSNNIYYDSDGMIRQNGTAMSVMTASLMKNFRIWLFHLDNRALFQVSSNSDVIPLPMLTLNLRYYLQFTVVRDAMQMQIGADGRWFTNWYMSGYNPAVGVFYNQKDEKYGNYPVLDAFVNIQWKRACIFVKVENVAQGWPKHDIDYFSAHHYINTQRAIKFGIFWPFYILPAKNTGLGAAAAAAGGDMGGKGGGRPKGGMKTAN